MTKRNVLYVGNFADKNSSLGYCPNAEWIADTFRECGHTVTCFNECNVSSEDILKELENEKYDFILTEEGRLKGDFLNGGDRDIIFGYFKDVLDHSSVPIVAWLTNIFYGIVRREDHIKYNPIFKADIVFSTDGGNQKRFGEAGVNHVLLRQGIYQKEAYLGEPIYPTKAEIVFVGSIYEHIWNYRKQLIDFLKNEYGERFLHVGQRGEVRHKDLNNLLATAKIVIGDSVYSPYYWSNRIYEMIGRGGFLITPFVEGIDKEFVPYEHFVPYTLGDFPGLKRKIDYYLENDSERKKIQMAGFLHCKENHTYKHRVEEMLRILKEKHIIQ